MTTSIKEALKPCPFCGGSSTTEGALFTHGSYKKVGAVRCADCGARAPKVAWNTRATLQPSGERREALVTQVQGILGDKLTVSDDEIYGFGPASYAIVDLFLASGLVQNEAGWRTMDSAPKDGTPFIGAFWSIRWADSHRKGDVVTCWWQPEFDAFISSCREMSLAPGLTFENGEARQLHSPVIEPVTHWKPLDRPAIGSARNGGAET